MPITISGQNPTVAASLRPVGLTEGGLVTHVALTDSAWTALPTTPLSNRNSLQIQNISGNGAIILWNYSNSAPSTEGVRIEDGGFKERALTDDIIVYARVLASSGSSGTVVVEEVA